MGEVVHQVTPDANMNTHKQDQVAGSGGYEYSEILEKNRQLDEEHTYFIYD